MVTYERNVALVMSHRTCYHVEVEEKTLRRLELLIAKNKRLDYEIDKNIAFILLT